MTNSQLPEFPESYWRRSVNLPTFPKLQESMKVDVGIVGGGITGITAAYLLGKQNLNVALFEAGEILDGTTGYTTAKVTAQHGLIYDEIIQNSGIEKASLYYQAATEAKQFIKETIDQLQIECDYQREDAYLYTNTESYINKLENEKKAYDQLKINSELTENIPLNIPMKSALIMKDQAQFHPLKYLKELTEECQKLGVQFFEQTMVEDLEYNKQPTIITSDGPRVTCNYVISASHFPFYDKQSFFFARMYPERAYVTAIKSNKKFPGGMYINAESPTRSIRSTSINGEDLWLISGENHKTGQGESTITHYNELKEFAKQHIGIDELVYRWSAQDLTTLDKVPYIGPIKEDEDTVLVATGFRKWGMTNGTIAAKILSDHILEKDNPYKALYSPSRIEANPAVKEFSKINADVAKHMIKGKLDFKKNDIDELSADDATVTRINGKRTGVYKDKNKELHMVDTTCTHMKCEVDWNSGERTWDCPCHGSRFSYTGDVVEGPATEPLAKVENEM
ncbi:glycine/D-amino acid oxidase-like deaminating enzyme/nitrite reductase/ring-hydroxylating ferredoxin subunit [Virgibacillus natechei]|uniref:Glycine/D-amino acid oxidase-like deaminating enzyme/nitrite reductase/ring-hydroxylating ferredoxin subunit n=1 Tax=Virgibacillus natechei TaxID=1216297 RepID=A0ABS4ICZ8_9BACI|nr:FAD-dependent oxidoreductase [Virgibacillus natechei]MBP1967929.1 glycine/D-amino acid oxidase-like deaminating enzyme/nitrite reductase/ring-hydroxylating ferredoxin subunit [Virgibacillus natechei]UZD14780.1 FAD-dependent oxidoreductase [Virgibacillus natechei]